MDPPGPQPYWHHILLIRLDGARWITADPTGQLACDDLALEDEVIPLVRAADFPVAGRPLLAHDALTDLEMDDLRRRAAQLAEVLGLPAGAAAVPVADTQWLVSDTAHPMFGQEVPALVMSDPTRVRAEASVALVKLDEADSAEQRWATAERVRQLDRDTWRTEKREGAGRDPRLLAVRSTGGAEILYREAVRATTKERPLPARFAGPSALAEINDSIARSGLEPAGYTAEFLHTTGLSAKSGLAVEFSHHVHSLYLLHCVDRLDGRALATGEHVARRLLQVQRAVRRNPRAPDFEGLEGYMRHSDGASGVALSPAFDKHIAELQKTEATVLKFQRLAREEVDNETTRKKKTDKGVKGAGKSESPP